MGLLGDRYAPVTHGTGFLEADFEAVVAADTRWRSSIGGYTGRHVSGALPFLLDSLLPLTGPLLRYIWIGTSGNWTAYFDNFVNGSDPLGPISFLGQEIQCRGVTIGHRPQTAKAEGGMSFEIYGPEKTEWLNLVRSVSAINDGGWNWHASGAVQAFEETQHYQARRVRDRLTPDLLNRYCRALEIDGFDESFYGSEGWLVENNNVERNASVIRSETLAQAQKELGLM